AGLEGGPEAVGDTRRLPRPLLPDRGAQHRGRRRGREAASTGAALRERGRGKPPRRTFGRRRRLAHERPAVEHGTAAAVESRSTDAGTDGAQTGRSARGHSLVTIELGHVTARKLPLKYAAFTRVGFSDTDAQGIVYYGRYLPYFDLARVEYHRNLGLLGMDIGDEGQEFVMRACNIEYLAPAVFDDLIEVYVRLARIGRTSVTYELAAYRARDDELMVTATQTLVLVDLDERKAVPIPESYKDAIRSFEGETLEV